MKINHYLRMLTFGITTALFISSAYAAETLHAVGSTTVMPIMSNAATAFHKIHPDISITVSGGGSGVGIASMIQHTAQIGMASRETTDGERKQLDNQVENIVIARDAVAVVVSKAVYLGGITHLSLAQIAQIYRAEITNWKQLGGPDAKILAIDKEASRGTRHVFAEAVLGSAHARAPGASLISGSNNEEQAIVARSNQAIGMLSNAWLNDQVRGIAIDVDGVGIKPTIEQIRNGRYPISRGLHVLIAKNATPATRALIQFLLSKAGQDIVKQAGYLPIR
ncbi:MAG: substrate-binding domain-containing protein [Mariprofundus sp.]|nr:substrate-binding domain-containing protein [Mariprofundus sp.]